MDVFLGMPILERPGANVRRVVGQLVGEANEFARNAETLQRKATALQVSASAMGFALQEFGAALLAMSESGAGGEVAVEGGGIGPAVAPQEGEVLAEAAQALALLSESMLVRLAARG